MIDTPKIKDIKGITFIVPSYQRGYKWRKRDVEYLIDDLYEYDSDRPYYMQPIVTAKKDDNTYILVDGQQRLTTFYLIWRVMFNHRAECGLEGLEVPGYTIKYEKHDKSTEYLEQNTIVEETPDIRNFINAEEVAKIKLDILKDKKFQDKFFNRATFLWYELDNPDEGPAMFERLNGKRIALTDVELCKVLLLSDNQASVVLRSERAFAWENIEYKLQDDRLYSFISSNHDTGHDTSRMGLLLDLLIKKHTIDDNAKVEYFEYPIYHSLKEIIGKIDVWKEMNQIYHRIEQWFDNPLYYNLIGFLVSATDVTLNDIMKLSGHEEFGEELKGMIKKWVGTGKNIRELVYQDNKTKSTLLLFNILCELQEIEHPVSNKLEDRFRFNHKFRFDLYKAENYDKEHIHATHSDSLQSAIEWQQWCEIVLKYQAEDNEIKPEILKTMKDVIGIKADMSIEDESKRHDKLVREIIERIGGKDGFVAIFNNVSSTYGEDPDDDLAQNSIGNMALLSARINRDQAYAAAPFAVKRAIINERMSQGYFVPKGTERMFSKSFRPHPDEMFHWNKNTYKNNMPSDTDTFIDFFATTIEHFIE